MLLFCSWVVRLKNFCALQFPLKFLRRVHSNFVLSYVLLKKHRRGLVIVHAQYESAGPVSNPSLGSLRAALPTSHSSYSGWWMGTWGTLGKGKGDDSGFTLHGHPWTMGLYTPQDQGPKRQRWVPRPRETCSEGSNFACLHCRFFLDFRKVFINFFSAKIFFFVVDCMSVVGGDCKFRFSVLQVCMWLS